MKTTRDARAGTAADAAPDRRRLAALINPLSFRMSLRDRAERTEARIAEAGGRAYRVTDLPAIEAALADAIEGGVDTLVLAGGDGTLQGAVSYLARHLPAEQLPELLVLSAGRTNYVAADLGTRAHFLATLDRLLDDGREAARLERRTLVVRHPSIDTQHGFFLAGAMLDQVIRNVHRWRNARPGWRRNHHLASAFGVLRQLPALLTGREPFTARHLRLDAEALGTLDAPMRFLLMTTLGLDDSHARPYAERGDGDLRVTAISAAAQRWRRRMATIVRGRFSDDMSPATGYLSGHCRRLTIEGIDSIVLDGQEFDLDPAYPLRVEPGPSLGFLRP
ncbi:diacylglycerol kinase family protein [Halomonas denitrificans]|nr:NAD(+)/NADH kinase [Halomonas denitrificans]